MDKNTKSKSNKRQRGNDNISSEEEVLPDAVSEENYDDDEKEYDFGNNEEIKTKGKEKSKKRLKKSKQSDSDSIKDKKRRLKKGGFKEASNEDGGDQVFMDSNESSTESEINILFEEKESEEESQEMTME